MNRSVAVVAAVGLLSGGAVLTYFGLRAGRTGGEPEATMPAADAPQQLRPAVAPDSGNVPATAGRDARLPDVQVTLSEDAVQRAGIVVAPVTRGTSSSELRLPGVVEPNAYRQVVVTPLVGGRVTQVSAELGQRVR
ncbi:MAG: hypothetical protein ACRETX_11595, partial [Steroidobacteraceae bacterium]